MAKAKTVPPGVITESSGSVPQTELDALKSFLPTLGNLSFVRSTPSAVTTAWGVKWDETLVSRDLMQNFRDANKETIDRITVSSSKGDVLIHGPAEFNLNRLYYLGSEKSAAENDIGQYGEGFKAASLALLRDFKVIPYVVSGKNIVRLSVSKETVEDTDLRPIIYEYFTHDGNVSGSYMLILGCSKELTRAIETSLEHFFWLGHPKIGEPIFSSAIVDVYRSNGADGYGFYQGLRRLTITSVPLIFNLKKDYKNLNKKIEADRDRKAFDEKVSTMFYGLITKPLDVPTAREILSLTKPIWPKGHPLLSRLSENYAHLSNLHTEFLIERFGDLFSPRDSYFARIENQWYLQEHPEIKAFNDKFIAERRTPLPGYFVNFGVPNASRAAESESVRVANAIREAPNTKPTALEMMAIQFMVNIVKGLSRQLAQLASSSRYTYLVAHTDEIMGQLRSSTRHRAAEVVLASSIFLEPFHTAVSTLIHEWAHSYGYDGDRYFTDALTNVLESIIENRDRLGEAEAWWNNHRQMLTEERLSPNRSARARLMTMPDAEIQQLFAKAPEPLLAELLNGDQSRDASAKECRETGLAECLSSMTPGDRVLILLTNESINSAMSGVNDAVVSPVFSFLKYDPATMSMTVALPSGDCSKVIVVMSETPNAILVVQNRSFDVFLNKMELQKPPALSSLAAYGEELEAAIKATESSQILFIDAGGKQRVLTLRFDIDADASEDLPEVDNDDAIYVYCEENGELDRLFINPHRRGRCQIKLRERDLACEAVLMSEMSFNFCEQHGYHIEQFGGGFCQSVVMKRRPDMVMEFLKQCATSLGIPPYPVNCRINIFRCGMMVVDRDGKGKRMDILDFSDFSASQLNLPAIPAFFTLPLDIKEDYSVGDKVLFLADIYDEDIGKIRCITECIGEADDYAIWLLDDEFEADKMYLYKVPSNLVGLKA